MGSSDDLRDLHRKVSAGEVAVIGWRSFRALSGGYGVYLDHDAGAAMNAYNGVLDQAFALHQSKLPGWDADICLAYWDTDEIRASYVTIRHPSNGASYKATSHVSPARAWLIAILEAMLERREALKELGRLGQEYDAG